MRENAEALDTKTVASDVMMGSVVLSQEVDRILDGLEALSRHRLSPHLILPGQMAEALSALRESMRRNGYELAIDNVFQLFQLDTSHLYYGNQTIEIIVHIPAFKPNNIMTLYKHRNMPVRFDGLDELGKNGPPLYLQPQSQDVYLAVDVSETAFQTFTLGRLQTCTQLFGLYVCPRNNVVDKRTSQECLMALFTGKMSQVRAVC